MHFEENADDTTDIIMKENNENVEREFLYS